MFVDGGANVNLKSTWHDGRSNSDLEANLNVNTDSGFLNLNVKSMWLDGKGSQSVIRY